MNVYIPFNMIIDTDFGIIRLIELSQGVSEYPINDMKSFLLNRKEVNPIKEYSELRELTIPYVNDVLPAILEKFYDKILELSYFTDMIGFVVNTYKLGLSNDVNIVIGCDSESEIKYLNTVLSSIDYTFNIELNSDINLNDFSCIFTKFIDDEYVDYLLKTLDIHEKRIYVADYNFNTLYDKESNTKIIDPILHMRLESAGNVLCTVSLYNKK